MKREREQGGHMDRTADMSLLERQLKLIPGRYRQSSADYRPVDMTGGLPSSTM